MIQMLKHELLPGLHSASRRLAGRARPARRRRFEATCSATGYLKVCAAFLCLPLLAGCGESETAPDDFAPAPPPTPELLVAGFQSDPAALRRGQELFLGSCVSFCHGLIGEEPVQGGDALFLFDCHWQHARDNADIFRIIKEGIPDTRMVGFGDNFPEGDADVWKIIAWIRGSQGRC